MPRQRSDWCRLGLLAVLLGFVATCAAQAAAASTVHLPVTLFEVGGDNPLSAQQTEAILQPYRGDLQGLAELQEAVRALERALRQAGYPFHRVHLPPQTIDRGVVRLQVVAYRIGSIDVRGRSAHTEANILRAIPSLTLGAVPNTRAIGRELALSNRNPSKDIKVRFRDRYRDEMIDAEVRVADRVPREYFTWFNNGGTRDTEDTRLGIGLRHNNLWDRDHQLAITYTTSPQSPSDIKQYGLLYDIPHYRWSSVVSLLALHSDIDSGRVAGAFDVSGRGTVFGARLTRILQRVRGYSHEWSLSVADKKFDDDTAFLGQTLGVARPDVRSRPLALEYRGFWKGRWGQGDFYARPLLNTRTGPDNNEAAYRQNRFAADPDWWALRAGASVHYALGRWSLRGQLEGQYAEEPLISGEQFGLGGARSVRGFEEREITGDRGYLLRLELWAPVRWSALHLLGFLDAGALEREDPLPDEIDNQRIASVGLGVRWSWQRNVHVQADYGYVVNGINRAVPGDLTEDGDSKLHFTILLSF